MEIIATGKGNAGGAAAPRRISGGEATGPGRRGRDPRPRRDSPPGKWWTLTAVCLGTFMLLLDISIVYVAVARSAARRSPEPARCTRWRPRVARSPRRSSSGTTRKLIAHLPPPTRRAGHHPPQGLPRPAGSAGPSPRCKPEPPALARARVTRGGRPGARAISTGGGGGSPPLTLDMGRRCAGRPARRGSRLRAFRRTICGVRCGWPKPRLW